MRTALTGCLVAAVLSGTAVTVAAQAAAPQAAEILPAFWPGAQYDASIPTLQQVLGHQPGEVITSPDGIVTYLRALAQAAPTRARLIDYGRTWEGRPLVVMAIGSPERLAQLDTVKAGLRKLADPRTLAANEESGLLASLPVVVWLMHGVHGNEISSSDAALLEAYHLLAARGDANVDTILREAIVLIDPSENPDGRARFLATNAAASGPDPDAEPFSAEHNEPWPGGRSNHYLFDLNRDWFIQSQVETQGRTRFFLEWFPQVVVDLHEMGGDSSYYFAPPADPLNPHITNDQVKWFNTIGRANGERFDERGFSYFVREVYDSFYPGYGESWPIFHGSIGMTYEMASARGLAYRRRDGTILTYRDGVLRHFTSAITTAHTAASNREAILRDFLTYRRSAITEGEKDAVKGWLLPLGHDPARAHRLARVLRDQGFDVLQTTESVTVGSRTVPAGAYLVPAAQPGGRLLRNLMDPTIAQPESFVKEQVRRLEKRLPDQMYDVTGWHLPASFDVEALSIERPLSGIRTRAIEMPPVAPLPAARVGYLLPWGTGTASLVIAAQRAGLKVRFADEGFSLGGRTYPVGTAIIRTPENPADLPAILTKLVAEHQSEAVPVDVSFPESGISLGSGLVRVLKAPRILFAWDAPTSTQSAGWARYVLERRYGQSVTAVRVSALGMADFTRFDVIVLPSGNYAQGLNGPQLQRLKDWISAGGTLVTIAEATRWATRDGVELLDTTAEMRSGTLAGASSGGGQPKRPGGGANAASATGATDTTKGAFDLEAATLPKEEPPVATSGALVRVALDAEHWLTAGTDGEVQAMVEGSRIFTPLRLDKGRNVGTYVAGDRAVAAGLVWPDAKAQLGNKAFLMVQRRGRGQVIAFAEDPNFRAFLEGTQLLFINAVLLGPAH